VGEPLEQTALRTFPSGSVERGCTGPIEQKELGDDAS
jgi:hypothetical protein